MTDHDLIMTVRANRKRGFYTKQYIGLISTTLNRIADRSRKTNSYNKQQTAMYFWYIVIQCRIWKNLFSGNSMHGANKRGVTGLSLTPHEIMFPRSAAQEHMEII